MSLAKSSGLALQDQQCSSIPISAEFCVWAYYQLPKLESSILCNKDSFSLYRTSPGVILCKLKVLMIYQFQLSFALIQVHFLSFVLYQQIFQINNLTMNLYIHLFINLLIYSINTKCLLCIRLLEQPFTALKDSLRISIGVYIPVGFQFGVRQLF